MDEQALGSVLRFIVQACTFCFLYVPIRLSSLEKPLGNVWAGMDWLDGDEELCPHDISQRQLREIVRLQVEPLEIIDGNRRRMTKEALRAIFDQIK